MCEYDVCVLCIETNKQTSKQAKHLHKPIDVFWVKGRHSYKSLLIAEAEDSETNEPPSELERSVMSKCLHII